MPLFSRSSKKSPNKDPQQTSYAKGVAAESKAAEFLIGGGYKIIEQRYKTKFGEIDIIAQKDNILCFIEVKVRRNYADALEAVTPRSCRRIERSALFYLSENPESLTRDMRFDVIAITEGCKISHLDNAWQASS